MPLEGPPLPKGWSPTWNELSQLFKDPDFAAKGIQRETAE